MHKGTQNHWSCTGLTFSGFFTSATRLTQPQITFRGVAGLLEQSGSSKVYVSYAFTAFLSQHSHNGPCWHGNSLPVSLHPVLWLTPVNISPRLLIGLSYYVSYVGRSRYAQAPLNLSLLGAFAAVMPPLPEVLSGAHSSDTPRGSVNVNVHVYSMRVGGLFLFIHAPCWCVCWAPASCPLLHKAEWIQQALEGGRPPALTQNHVLAN